VNSSEKEKEKARGEGEGEEEGGCKGMESRRRMKCCERLPLGVSDLRQLTGACEE
jgi:hypothetical protein